MVAGALVTLIPYDQEEQVQPAKPLFKNLVAGVGFEPTTFGL